MTSLATGTADRPSSLPPPSRIDSAPVRVHGKFFFVGGQKHFVKGVTYGPFSAAGHGAPFPPRAKVERDFAVMAVAGINTVRVFTPPPRWLLDAAGEAGLRLLIGLPWAQHIAFLDNRESRAQIRRAVAREVREGAGHPAVFAYLVGNEIPPDILRWHGVAPVRRFLRGLVAAVRDEAPHTPVSYANFPSTEYLTVDFTDFLSFNLYLHQETAFRRYLARLHHFALDRPLVLTEFGVDSLHEGAGVQQRILSWQIRAAYQAGVAGTFVFSWTDEWFTGGHPVEDWAFGLVDRARRKKPALAAVKRQYGGALPPPLRRYPRVSVVVCAYNAERTIDRCLASLDGLNYPDYEILVVNDGSSDNTLEIAQGHAACRIISQPNQGLSAARNVGAEAASGEIVAYTDSDCVADPDWLNYLVAKMEVGDLLACGGPNLPPAADSLVPAAVAVAPGGPTHVLLDDETAEHIAGCNMAFQRAALLRLGGFDPIFRTAGDDIDICWRFQDAGYAIGFAPAAIVWHFRRNTVAGYLRQQRGYGKAEALVRSKHPSRFNQLGQAKWLGRIYGDLSASLRLARRPIIYSGVFGQGLFQTLYERPFSIGAALPLSFEWGAGALALAISGVVGGGWWRLLGLPLLVTLVMCVNGARKAPVDPRFAGPRAFALVAALIYLGPLLRGWERLRWRLREVRGRSRPVLPATEQRAHPLWSKRGFEIAYWSEQPLEKEALLRPLIALLAARECIVTIDSGWNRWDLEVKRGPGSRARILVCVESHDGGRRLFRVRCTVRLSEPARILLSGAAASAAAALILGSLPTAAGFGAAGLAALAAAAAGLFGFAREMHRSVETIALELPLAPLEHLAATPSPALRPV